MFSIKTFVVKPSAISEASYCSLIKPIVLTMTCKAVCCLLQPNYEPHLPLLLFSLTLTTQSMFNSLHFFSFSLGPCCSPYQNVLFLTLSILTPSSLAGSKSFLGVFLHVDFSSCPQTRLSLDLYFFFRGLVPI